MAMRSDLHTLLENARTAQDLALEILTLSGEYHQKVKASGQPLSPELDEYLGAVARRAQVIEKRSGESTALIDED